MIYKINKISNVESFNPIKILIDLLKGYSSIVIILTEKIELNESDYKLLTREQVQHIMNISVLSDKVNYLISHSVINIFYCKLMNCSIDELDYYYNPYGKPYITNKSNIKFNISHTTGCSVIAFSYANIGVDIENTERKIEFENIVNYHFSNFEKNYINSEVIKFFEVWVAKEAYLKCKGYGLLKGLKNAKINVIKSNYFEIINENKYTNHIIKIEYIYSRFVIGITTEEIKDE